MASLLAVLMAVFLLTVPSGTAVAQSDTLEGSFWESVRDSKDAAELKAYLEAYPKGKFAPLARLRLEKLKKPTAAAPQAPSQPAPRAVRSYDPATIPDMVERVINSVVNISTTVEVKAAESKEQKKAPLPRAPKGSPFEEFFEEFMKRQGDRKGGKARKVKSLGSGFVIDESGLIVTNNHVIEGADEITVGFHDGTKLKVRRVVGRDKKTDIALLQVDAKSPLRPVSFGDSSTLRVGEQVIAIGNPFGLGGSVSSGIVSAMKRDINAGPYDEFIQTDAGVNRGNAGGPLFNLKGEVIGINAAILSPSGASVGIGFAIPSSTAIAVIEQLRKFGEIRRGWLGVRIQSVTDQIADSLGMAKPAGALVAGVTASSPAARAGFQTGDVIIRFDGQDVSDMRELPRIVARTQIGKKVEVDILREGKRRTLNVELGRLPETAAATEAEPTPKRKEARPETGALLGLSISSMSDELRTRFKISDQVKGVVITRVDSSSAAAQKNVKPGDVIVEVTQRPVSTPQDVEKEVERIRRAGRRSILLLLSNPKSELRFVAISLS